MAFLAHISMKPETNALKAAIIMTANPIKEKISFWHYRHTVLYKRRHQAMV